MTAAAPTTSFASRFPLFARALFPSALLVTGAVGVLMLRLALYHGGTDARYRGGTDAHAYWLAVQGPLSYSRPPMQLDAFLYSPLFADVIRPFGALPWPVFWLGWAAAEAAVFAWLLWPARRWAVPLWLLCTPELVNGNVYAFFGLVLVLGFRRPALWVFPILTKVVGGVGLLWFVVRGEWRRLLTAAAVLLLLVGVSYLMQPAEWMAWVRFLLEQRGSSRDGVWGLAARGLIAAGIVVVAARTDRRWLVAVAVAVVNPVYGVTTLTVLAAVPRLLEERQELAAVVGGSRGRARERADREGVVRGEEIERVGSRRVGATRSTSEDHGRVRGRTTIRGRTRVVREELCPSTRIQPRFDPASGG